MTWADKMAAKDRKEEQLREPMRRWELCEPCTNEGPPREWWIWERWMRGDHVLAIEAKGTVASQLDYRSRVTLRRDNALSATHVIQNQIAAQHRDAFSVVLTPYSMGSMAMFKTIFQSTADTTHTEVSVIPPLFHLCTIETLPPPRLLDDARRWTRANANGDYDFKLWIQPWLHANGKHGLFYSLPYDAKLGYQDLVLSPLLSFPQLFARSGFRDYLEVAIDAFFQNGSKPDERFLRYAHDDVG